MIELGLEITYATRQAVIIVPVSKIRREGNKIAYSNIPPKSPRDLRGAGCTSDRSVAKLLSCFITCTCKLGQPNLSDRAPTCLLKLVLALLQVKVPPHCRVLTCKLDNLPTVEVVQQSRVNLAGELHAGSKRYRIDLAEARRTW